MNAAIRRRTAAVTTASIFVIMLAGQFSPNRLGIPYDAPIPFYALITLAALVVLVYPATRRMVSGPAPDPLVGFAPMVALFGVLMVSSLWAAGQPDSADDVWSLATMIALLVLVRASIRLSRETTITTFLTLSAVAGILFSIAGLLSVNGIARISAFGGGPNVFARVTGMAMIAVIYLVMTRRRSGWLIIALIPLGFATVLSGSRGAMLGLLVAMALLVCAFRRHVWSRVLLGLLLAAPVIVVLVGRYGANALRAVDTRIVQLTIEDAYLAGRDVLWAEAVAMIRDRPLVGWGLGTFIDIHGTYPHNVILQIGTDAGIVGLAFFAIVMWVVLLRLPVIDFRDPTVIAPVGGAALLFIASLFSGGYYDTRFLWVYMLLATSAPVLAGARAAVRKEPAAALPTGTAGDTDPPVPAMTTSRTDVPG